MVIALKVYVEHDDLPLTPTIRSLSDVELGVFSDAGTDPEHDVYIFWIEAPDFGAVERSLAGDHTIADYTVIVESEDRWTCRMEYTDDVTLITPAILESGGLTVQSRSYSNGWMIHLQLRDHDALFELNEYAKSEGIHLDILELHQDEGHDEDDRFGLTEAQRTALVTAFVQGYFDDPRNASLEELASTLDISTTAVSGRLRRASARLIEDVLMEED
jgi:predicted DNA binding protein